MSLLPIYLSSNAQIYGSVINTTSSVNYFQGNVGIGTTLPTGALEVTGNAVVNGSVSVNQGNLQVAGGIGRWKAFPRDNGGTITTAYTSVLGMDGQIYHAGENSYGVAGNYGTFNGALPAFMRASMPYGEVVTMFCVTNAAKMALTQSNRLYSWGRGQHGILGLGNTTDYYFPQLVSTVSDTIVDIQFGCGEIGGNQEQPKQAGYLTSTGRLFLWGYNNEGQVGNGTVTTPVTSPYEVPRISSQNWGGFALQTISSFAWTDAASGNKLYATGYNYNGSLGVGDQSVRNTMTACLKASDSSQLTNIKKVRTNNNWIGTNTIFTVALTNSGDVYTCGYNGYGQCGTGNTTTPQTKFYGPVLTNVKDFAIGRSGTLHSVFAIKNDGTLWVWGYNTNQHFGTTSIALNATVTTPTQVTEITDAIALYGPQLTDIGMMYLQKSDRSWWFAGNSTYGVSGLANNTVYSTWTKLTLPEEMVEVRTFRFWWINTDGNHSQTFMLGKSGRLWGAGRDNSGQLGLGYQHDANGFNYGGLLPVYTVLGG